MPSPKELSGAERDAVAVPSWGQDVDALASFIWGHVRPYLRQLNQEVSPGKRLRPDVMDFGPGPRGQIEALAIRLGLGPCKVTQIDRRNYFSAYELTEYSLVAIQESVPLNSRLSPNNLSITFIEGDIKDPSINIPPQHIIFAFNIYPGFADDVDGISTLVDHLTSHGILIITTHDEKEWGITQRQIARLEALGSIHTLENGQITPPLILGARRTNLNERFLSIVRRTNMTE